jgi:hypothetical protein
MEYVARDAVADVKRERHGLHSRTNFSMPWPAPYLKIRDLLKLLHNDARTG